jgi:hypothetical protein
MKPFESQKNQTASVSKYPKTTTKYTFPLSSPQIPQKVNKIAPLFPTIKTFFTEFRMTDVRNK